MLIKGYFQQQNSCAGGNNKVLTMLAGNGGELALHIRYGFKLLV